MVCRSFGVAGWLCFALGCGGSTSGSDSPADLGQRYEGPVEPVANGIEFPKKYKNWPVLSVAHRLDKRLPDADPAAPGRVFVARDLDPESDLEARSLWDADALAHDARASVARLRASAERLAGLDAGDAMVESFVVGGRVLRQLVRHPLLPPEILDPAPLDALLEEMKRYDRLGRDAWAAFLARHDVPHRALPLDAREPASDAAPALPA